MLCGVTLPKDDNETELSVHVQNSHGDKVELDDNTFPNHMHHSGITNGSNVRCLEGSSTNDSNYTPDKIHYDMFHNDSNSSGLENNNMDGVVDKFSVNDCGEEKLYHNNMPPYQKFYAFEVRKIQ